MKSTLTSISLSLIPVFVLVLALGTLSEASAATTQSESEKLSKHELQSLLASAKTPADHERIAQYYEAKAQSDLAEAQQQEKLAAQFRQNPLTASPKWATGTVNHCEYEAQNLTQEAAKLQQLAHQHEQMAQKAIGQ